MKTLILTTTFSLLFAGTLVAGDCGPGGGCEPQCCNQCGGAASCQIVCEMEKVKKTVWTVECEEFCPLLPGCGILGSLCCSGCGKDCDCGSCDSCGLNASCTKDSCDPCASLQRHMHPPKCGKVRTKKILVKKEITCEVPVYKTVVVCSGGCGVCGTLEAGQQAAPVPAKQTATAAPLPPVVPSVMHR